MRSKLPSIAFVRICSGNMADVPLLAGRGSSVNLRLKHATVRVWSKLQEAVRGHNDLPGLGMFT